MAKCCDYKTSQLHHDLLVCQGDNFLGSEELLVDAAIRVQHARRAEQAPHVQSILHALLLLVCYMWLLLVVVLRLCHVLLLLLLLLLQVCHMLLLLLQVCNMLLLLLLLLRVCHMLLLLLLLQVLLRMV
jgi:hypothetical protein